MDTFFCFVFFSVFNIMIIQNKQNNSLLIMNSKDFKLRDKIAAFDYGSTLFWNNDHWYHPELPEILRKFYEDGYCIIILSNQNGMLSKKEEKKCKKFIENVKTIEIDVGCPIHVKASCREDENRKPNTGMWDETWSKDAFYVGDRRTDQQFAKEIGIRFYWIDGFIRTYR